MTQPSEVSAEIQETKTFAPTSPKAMAMPWQGPRSWVLFVFWVEIFHGLVSHKKNIETRVENWVAIGGGHLNIGSMSFSFGMEMRAVQHPKSANG